ncbi:acetoin utilization protein AcuC [Paenibacillus aurantius]|uniref:Acetoin utilization protein AcuC n=1 Tax=Paenibacillus aurantius TaxID=2918900 RepID=A0AA96RH39_9BACL|nr:acetoin utilization protein AcuC [Paenibacillus aurantius]WNQ13632.1 acetoin utilization protein AcuC [Paenibacillus aurantius]
MKDASVFIYDPEESDYRFNDEHPFNQKRLDLTVDLLNRMGALPEEALRKPITAEAEKLLLVHSEEYIQAVRELSCPSPREPWLSAAERYGLRTEDTPFFPRMHEITSHVVGGSLLAAELVMKGETKHALHLGGGLHHALRNQGAGFCVYNDASIAIAHLKKEYQARVLYIDTDVHHGDGVQWSFYSDPDVCTFSIHETGKYLFPGTGGVPERGEGEGFGFSVNLPVEPYTEDDSWMECFEEVLERTAATFRPDVIVSQHGCDAHAYDPLAHVHCSMRIYKEMPALIHKLAHTWCGGRWIALGGGGYDLWRVVPRAWSLVWLTMTDHPLLKQLEENPKLPLPLEWLDRWQPESPVELPPTWLDPVDCWTPMPRRIDITAKNKVTKELAMLYLNK